jgi:hypothetical protein
MILAAATLLCLTAGVQAKAPARPLELTSAQFDGLTALESQPQHAAVLDLHASYTSEEASEREKTHETTMLVNDILTAAYTGGFPVGLLIVLIAAAPL